MQWAHSRHSSRTTSGQRSTRSRSDHAPLLLSVGLLEPEYDVPAQVRALESLRTDPPGAGLLLIGSGSLEAELRALIAASPAREHILLAGDVPHRRTLQAIASCSALLRTTLYDGDAISVREALALGTPVIATDNGMRPAGVHLVPLGSAVALNTAVTARARHPAPCDWGRGPGFPGKPGRRRRDLWRVTVSAGCSASCAVGHRAS